MNASAHHQPAGGHLDDETVARLRRDVGDAVLQRFAQTYVDQLNERLNRIARALNEDDNADALRAAVDLESGSVTIGAVRIAELARGLEDLLSRIPVAQASRLLLLARREAEAVAAELGQTLGMGEEGPAHGEPNR
jgi:HPt (histidine-containing phosphotransfer) domain-containing protein